MKPTLQEIARIAGVSLSTVSLVLSNKGNISDEVRNKVRTVASNLGYRKCQSSQDGKPRKVVILFHFDHHLAHTWNMLRQVTLELQSHLQQLNYLTLLIPITYDMRDDEIFSKVVATGAVVVFSMHFGRESLFTQFEKAAIPVVVIINSQFQSKFHTVCADNFQGSYEAASYLIELGHRNIIYAEFDLYQLPVTLSDRYLGFYKAMKEAGIEFPEAQRLRLTIDDAADTKHKFKEIFRKKNSPTAIFFIDDYIAASCVHILEDLNLTFSKEISIIAAGEVLDYNESFIPRITTMWTSPIQLGKFSAEMAFSILTNAQETNNVLKIKQQLIDRGSCHDISV